MWLSLLHVLFTLFHTALIAFNLVGWLWKPLRKWHLVIISLTLLSWVGLGFWFGWGYCPLTDWHWLVLRKMGVDNLPNSFVTWLLERLTGKAVEPALADGLTLWLGLGAFTMSCVMNLRDKKRALQ